jgi:nucleoside-diphosphate-sugar epimerase
VRVLVTGATGYVGGAVARALRTAGHQVVTLVRSGSLKHTPEGFEVVVGDLTRPETYRAAVEAADCVVHAGQRRTRGRITDRQVRLLAETDATAVATIAAAARAGGTRVVYTSGAFVFGDHGADWVDEDTPFTPVPLGTYHAAGVRALRAAEVDLRVLTLGFVYGPGGNFTTILYDPARRGILRCPGPGDNYWSPVHRDDAAAAYVAAVEHPTGGEWLIADDRPQPLRDLVDQVTDALGRKRVGSAPPALLGLAAGFPAVRSVLTSYRMSNARARAELGWKPAHPTFADGLPATLAALGRPARTGGS